MSDLWFAWHPVKLNNGKWAWLRNVHRIQRGTISMNHVEDLWWEYWA